MVQAEEGHVMTEQEMQEILPQPKRKDWQINQQKISNAILSFFRDNQKQPTYPEIAKLAGVSEDTVYRHMKETDFASLFQEQRERFAQLAPNVLMSIYNSAMKGSSKSQEMMLQVIFGWASPKFYDPPAVQEETNDEEMKQLDAGIEMLLAMRERQRERYGDGAAASDSTAERPTS